MGEKLVSSVERLKQREIRPELEKMELRERRFSHLRTRSTDAWTKKELSVTLKTLKNNKSRDPAGLINEIFKPPLMGRDLEDTLLQLIKAFDALWVENCMNDLWNTLPAHARDDRLGLV